MKNSARGIQNRLKKILVVLSIGLLVYSFIGLFSPKASAQESPRILTIIPPSKELRLDPGDRSEGDLKLINDSKQTLTFSAAAQDFIVEDTRGTPTILPAGSVPKRFSGAAWLGIVPSTFTVAPHEKAVLHYYLQVPSDARPGGHYAAVVYSPQEIIGVTGTGTSVQTQLGTLFSIDVNGPITEEAVVSQFSAEHFQESGPVHILTQIRNYSDIHIKPKGSIVVTNLWGQRVATIPFDEHNIFPTAARDYISIFDKKFMIGRYTAKLLLSYGQKNNLPLLATISFIVFPWRLALIIFLLLAAGVLGYFVWIRRKEIKEWEEHMRKHHPEE